MAVILKRLGVVDMTTLDSIQVPNVMAGVGDATSFGLTREDTDLSIEDEQDVNFLTSFKLAIRGIAQDGNLAFLQAVKDNERYVKFVGLNVDTIFQWSIPSRLIWLDKIDSKLHAWKIGAGTQVRTGYDPETGILDGGIHVGYNVLGMHKWDSSNGSGTPDGMSLAGNYVSRTFSDGVFSIDFSDTKDDAIVSKRILFPFPSTSLTLAVDRISSNCNITARIRSFDKNGSELNQTCSVSRTSSQGAFERMVASGKTPLNTHEIQFEIETTYTGTGSQTVQYRNPVIRLDGQTAYSPI